MRKSKTGFVAIGVFVSFLYFTALVPETLAQSRFTGLVRDQSGAVLPGVSVEASSPALIEKSRSTVTDERGTYKIIDLRPGNYSLTFTLPGFKTVMREVELPSDFTATINAEMTVGAVEESITVAAESPVVDSQTNFKAQVLPRATCWTRCLRLTPSNRRDSSSSEFRWMRPMWAVRVRCNRPTSTFMGLARRKRPS